MIICHLLGGAFLIFPFSGWRASHMFLKDVYKSFISCHNTGEDHSLVTASWKCTFEHHGCKIFHIFFPSSLLFLLSYFQKVQIYTRRARGLKYSLHICRAIIPNFIFQTSAWPSRPLDSSLLLATSDWYTVVLLRLTLLPFKCHFGPGDKYGFFLLYFQTVSTLHCHLPRWTILKIAIFSAYDGENLQGLRRRWVIAWQ